MPELRDLAFVRWWRSRSGLSRGLHLLPVLLAVVLPFVGIGPMAVNIVVSIGIHMILALGLNVVVGYTGLLELGYVTFIATGALVAALLLMTVRTPEGIIMPGGLTAMPLGDSLLGFPGNYLVILLLAGLLCALLGALRGLPTLRLSGDYYAIVTLGLAEIFYLIYFNEAWLTGGAFGLKLPMSARPELFGEKLFWDTHLFYYLVLVLLLLTTFAMYRLQNSRTGRAWAAIRLDETAARSCGINIEVSKTVAFAVSGFFGGVGGALYCVWLGTVAVRDMDVWLSIIVLCAVVLGGMGSIRGVLLGTAILISLGEVLRLEIGGLRVPPEARFLIYGMMLLLLMRFRPQGLIPRPQGGRPPSAEEEQRMRAREAALFVLDQAS